ncbi:MULTISPECIES: hypothetical protein [Haloferacaceae]|uniref:Uncharacterized protein n=2 Tax=Haloferacaceae TaxID=1644056 RepID=A0ABD6DDT3_9EURY|nr:MULTISPECIES: hypothetical protein [Halorubraceae]
METPVTQAQAQQALEAAFETEDDQPDLEVFMSLLREYQAYFLDEELEGHLESVHEGYIRIYAAYADCFVIETSYDAHSIGLGELGYGHQPLQRAVMNAHRKVAEEVEDEVGPDIYPIALNLPNRTTE